MGFISNKDLNKSKMSEPCTQAELDAKVREARIGKILDEDISEQVEWIQTHYVVRDIDIPFMNGITTITVRNPAKTIILRDVT